MNGLAIRAERPGDEQAVRAVIAAAFAGAPHSSGTEAVIVDSLRLDGALRLSLVAKEDEAVVGHIAFSPVTMGLRSEGWLGLGPVAVRPDRQGAGIGSALIRRSLAMLRDDGVPGCVLLGDPAYYARFGFASDPELSYDGRPSRYVQRLSLGGPMAGGEVRFHPAFATR